MRSNGAVVVNENKQKNIIIDTLKRRLNQSRSESIKKYDMEPDRLSMSSYGSVVQSFTGVAVHGFPYA